MTDPERRRRMTNKSDILDEFAKEIGELTTDDHLRDLLEAALKENRQQQAEIEELRRTIQIDQANKNRREYIVKMEAEIEELEKQIDRPWQQKAIKELQAENEELREYKNAALFTWETLPEYKRMKAEIEELRATIAAQEATINEHRAGTCGLCNMLQRQDCAKERLDLRAQVERMDRALRWIKGELPSLAADAGTDLDYCGEIDAIMAAMPK